MDLWLNTPKPPLEASGTSGIKAAVNGAPSFSMQEGRRTFANFMWVVGPVSSVFDFLTFFMLLKIFGAGEALFHTGWFIESIATQVMVIFIIRTRGNPFKSKPNIALAATSLTVVLVAAALPFTPFAASLGFVAPPPLFFLILLAMVFCYLVTVEFVKRYFYRHFMVK